MKSITATSFRSSTALLPPPPPPLSSPYLYNTGISLPKSLNSRKVVRAKLPNYSRRKAVLTSNSKTIVVPTSVPVRVAYELFLAGQRYLDVRLPEEFVGGHVPGAINIPYMYKNITGMCRNPDFVAQVLKHFKKDAEIIVGCQNGEKSIVAASDLEVNGFTGITDVAGGYKAWSESGLPTERDH
ncbi:thiosulfate sulfurtransferase 16, chloroplastic-like [Senna tora]|uniref:Thiosulfate sulfurtransferase 16, chloroplastic-like n=1 Tax=Senna tora TaxID=362788 RepID=A0A834T4U4_9FABA|nr:thiosulfate sulfurtransferase 16, chloroplastic-like [Senna tora]